MLIFMSDATGQVIEEWTGKPVSFATVKFNSFIATTDAEGKFQISVPSGSYNVEIIHRDYELTKFPVILPTEEAYTIDPFRVKPIFRAL